MTDPQRNGERQSTTVPSGHEWARITREAEEIRKAEDAQIGGSLRFLLKHWKTAALVVGGALGFWQWLQSQAVAVVLADQAEQHQAAQVLLNSNHRAESTLAEVATTKAVKANTEAIAANAESIETVLLVNLENPRTRSAVMRNEPLAKKARRVLGLKPSDDL